YLSRGTRGARRSPAPQLGGAAPLLCGGPWPHRADGSRQVESKAARRVRSAGHLGRRFARLAAEQRTSCCPPDGTVRPSLEELRRKARRLRLRSQSLFVGSAAAPQVLQTADDKRETEIAKGRNEAAASPKNSKGSESLVAMSSV